MATPVRAVVPAHWETAERVRLRNREVTPGTLLRVRGERGTFAFVRHVINTSRGTEWLDVRDANGALRAFRPERVRSIPRRQGRAA